MIRLLSIAIEVFASVIFIIPAMLLLQRLLQKRRCFRRTLLIIVFAMYLIAVFSATGIPSFKRLTVQLNFNLIPVIDIINSPAEYIKNTALNILLFMPLGFFLPVLWRQYRSPKSTVLTGFILSLSIEILQIFTYRLTDIDDLITNTLGTVIGFYLAGALRFRLPLTKATPDTDSSVRREPVIIWAITLLTAFFLQPSVSDKIWEIVLSGPLWESLR